MLYRATLPLIANCTDCTGPSASPHSISSCPSASPRSIRACPSHHQPNRSRRDAPSAAHPARKAVSIEEWQYKRILYSRAKQSGFPGEILAKCTLRQRFSGSERTKYAYIAKIGCPSVHFSEISPESRPQATREYKIIISCRTSREALGGARKPSGECSTEPLQSSLPASFASFSHSLLIPFASLSDAINNIVVWHFFLDTKQHWHVFGRLSV